VLYIALGALVGAHTSADAAAMGAGLIAVAFLPMYLKSGHERGLEYEEHLEHQDPQQAPHPHLARQ
jgi:hypothetical protein